EIGGAAAGGPSAAADSAAGGGACFCWAVAAAENGRLHQLQTSLVSLSSPHHLQNMHRLQAHYVSHTFNLYGQMAPVYCLTFPKAKTVSSKQTATIGGEGN